MQIDANLKNTVERWIELRQPMFAGEHLEQTIAHNEVLMFFGGLGLAGIGSPTSDTPIFVAAQSSAVDK